MATQHSDAVVLGGGLAGIVAALELLRAGQRVTLVDRDTPERFGGLALWAFGGMALVGTPLQAKMKIPDTPERALADWLRGSAAADSAARFILSLREGSQPLRTVTSDAKAVWVLHGPEGGLTAQEEDWALERGWKPASLGNRVLRAETASVAALSLLALE